MKITSLTAQEILDSRTHPTLRVNIELADGTKTAASVASGTSTGATEAFELRDNDPNRFNGRGVLKAVDNVNTTLAGIMVGQDAYNQKNIDQVLLSADGTPTKAKIGANAISGVSMAVCRAAAMSQGMELYRYFGQLSGNQLYMIPQPHIVVMEGGRHGHWSIDLQEVMVVPFISAFKSISEMLQASAQVFHELGTVIKAKGYDTGIGYAGVYAPTGMQSNEEALEMVSNAIMRAGYTIGQQFAISFDAAASEFFINGNYTLRSESNRVITEDEWIDQIATWVDKYQLWSVEDPLDQESWGAWTRLTTRIGDRCQVVGDDLLTTNPSRIAMAMQQKAVTAVTVKINQIGTISETIEAIQMSDQAGYRCIISHRGGETADDMIADLVVGTTATECKFGSPDHDERLLKYHRLQTIEEQVRQ